MLVLLPLVILIISYKIHFVQSEPHISCQEKFQCTNQTLVQNEIDLFGYKSAYGLMGSGVEISLPAVNVDAYGAYSAQYASHIITNQSSRCYGLHSCSFIPNITSLYQRIWCFGGLSCVGSSLHVGPGLEADSNYIECGGVQSCKDAYISDTERIIGSGSYSLQNAVITTNSSIYQSFYFVSHGFYAGYNATVICNKNVQCFFWCYGNGCINSNIICNECLLHLFCNDKEANYSSPNHCTSYDNYNQNITSINEGNSIIQDAFITSAKNEQTCNKGDNISVVFDSYLEHSNQFVVLTSDYNFENIENIGNICCRGYGSCVSNSYIRNTIPNGNIICIGDYSCGISAKGNESINWVETNQNYTNSNGSIFCMGVNSCYDSKLRASMNGSIHCGASGACALAKIYYPTKSLYCNGRTVDSGCSMAQVHGVSKVYLNSMVDMSIYSEGIGKMDVLLIGACERSVYPVGDIYCNIENDTCNIYCYTQGSCWNSTQGPNIHCSNGTRCNIYCDEANGILCGGSNNVSNNVYIFNISNIGKAGTSYSDGDEQSTTASFTIATTSIAKSITTTTTVINKSTIITTERDAVVTQRSTSTTVTEMTEVIMTSEIQKDENSSDSFWDKYEVEIIIGIFTFVIVACILIVVLLILCIHRYRKMNGVKTNQINIERMQTQSQVTQLTIVDDKITNTNNNNTITSDMAGNVNSNNNNGGDDDSDGIYSDHDDSNSASISTVDDMFDGTSKSRIGAEKQFETDATLGGETEGNATTLDHDIDSLEGNHNNVNDVIINKNVNMTTTNINVNNVQDDIDEGNTVEGLQKDFIDDDNDNDSVPANLQQTTIKWTKSGSKTAGSLTRCHTTNHL